MDNLNFIVAIIPAVLTSLWIVVFYSSLIVELCIKYVNDGESGFNGLRGLFKDGDDIVFWVSLYGIIAPSVAALVSRVAYHITLKTGTLVPYIVATALILWLILYTLRLVTRVNKKLAKHEEDKNAHK